MNPNTLFPSLHLIGSHQMGGAEQCCFRLVQALHEEGHPTNIVLRPDSPLMPVFREVQIEPLPMAYANVWDVWSLWHIRRLIAKIQPAIVQSYLGRATRLTRVPQASGSVHVARLDGFYKIDGFRHAQAWVGVSRKLCDYLVGSGLPADRVFHIGHFVPPPSVPSPEEREALRIRHAIPETAWVLFALGRFVEKKGFQELLAAFAALPETVAGRPVHLMIAGDGPIRESLHEQARQSNANARVHWLGWQNAPGHYFALADVFVCPSRHEPLGVVQLEAWNYRLPMVTTANEGASELVTDQDNALICPIADAKTMAETLLIMLNMPESERRAMGERGQALLQRRYSREVILGEYLDLYGRLTGI
ncbi:MAG: glycosyltransferase [Methylococcaceae bacterium]